MKDGNIGKMFSEFVGLKAKKTIVKIKKVNKTTAKGIKKSVTKNTITIHDLKDYLFKKKTQNSIEE